MRTSERSLWPTIGLMLILIGIYGIWVFGFLTTASTLLIPTSALVAFGLVGVFLSLRVNVPDFVRLLGAIVVFQGMRSLVQANHWMQWQTHHHAVALSLVWVNRGVFLAFVVFGAISFYQLFV